MKKILVSLLVLILGLGSLTACGAGQEDVIISGSSSVSPLMKELASDFESSNGKYLIRVTTSDSGTGFSDTVSGKNEIGMLSRNLKDSEKEQVDGVVLCQDGLAIIVNKKSELTNTTKEQLVALYMENIAIGSAKKAVSREDGSGTRGAFADITGIAKSAQLPATCEIQNSTGAVKTSIASDEAKLGYISLGSKDDTIKVLQYNGVDATTENIKNGTYTLSRPFFLVTKKGKTLSEGAKSFLEYLKSDNAKKIMTKSNYVV